MRARVKTSVARAVARPIATPSPAFLFDLDGTLTDNYLGIARSIAYRCGAFHLLAQSALRHTLPEGVSPAQVRGALTAVGAKQLKLISLPPPRTVTSVQESIQWAKAQTR